MFQSHVRTGARALHSSALVNQAFDKLRGLGQGQVHLESKEQGLRLMTFDNSSRRNALSGRMIAQLAQHVEALEQDSEATCVLVQGTGSFFCSGADLSSAAEKLTSAEDGLDMCILMQDTLNRLRNLPVISIAVIRGGAVGGGTELALSCDMRLMEQEARFQMVHSKMGLSPGWGGAARLVHLVGRAKALDVLVGGPKLSASECEDLGLVDAVAPMGQEFDDLVQRKVTALGQGYTSSIRACKLAIAAADLPVEEALRAESQVFGTVWGGAANRDALERVKKRR